MAKSLVYAQEGTYRENIRKGLMQSGLEPSFTQDTQNVTNLIAEIKPVVFLLDWQSLDHTRNTKLLRSVDSTDTDGQLMKVVCCEKPEPKLLAVANETDVRKVLTYAKLFLELKKLPSLVQMGSTEVQKFLNELRKLREQGEEEKCRELIDDMYEKYPDEVDVKLEYGNQALLRGDLQTAKSIAVDVLKQNNTNVRGMNLLSRVCMKTNDFESAAKVLERAEVLSPAQPQRLAMLGDAYYGKGDKEKAKDAYNHALTEDPNNSEAVNGLGTISLEENDTDALVDLFRAHSSEAETAGFFNNAAVQNVREGKLEESLKLYEIALSALKTEQFKSQIYFNLALNYRKLERYEEALKSAKRALKYNPEFEKAKTQYEQIENLLRQKTA